MIIQIAFVLSYLLMALLAAPTNSITTCVKYFYPESTIELEKKEKKLPVPSNFCSSMYTVIVNFAYCSPAVEVQSYLSPGRSSFRIITGLLSTPSACGRLSVLNERLLVSPLCTAPEHLAIHVAGANLCDSFIRKPTNNNFEEKKMQTFRERSFN